MSIKLKCNLLFFIWLIKSLFHTCPNGWRVNCSCLGTSLEKHCKINLCLCYLGIKPMILLYKYTRLLESYFHYHWNNRIWAFIFREKITKKVKGAMPSLWEIGRMWGLSWKNIEKLAHASCQPAESWLRGAVGVLLLPHMPLHPSCCLPPNAGCIYASPADSGFLWEMSATRGPQIYVRIRDEGIIPI